MASGMRAADSLSGVIRGRPSDAGAQLSSAGPLITPSGGSCAADCVWGVELFGGRGFESWFTDPK